MAFPVIPVLSGIAGLGAGAGIMGALGKGKKETEIKHAPYEYYAPTESEVYAPMYAPQVQYSPQISYAYQGGTYIIESPGATSKKEQHQQATLTPEQRGTWELPISVSQAPTHTPQYAEGADIGASLLPLAIVGVIGLVAYGIVTRKKK